MRPEEAIETEACRQCLENWGVRSLKLNVRGQTGFPDRLFFIPGGKPLFVEVKAPGAEPRPKQVWVHEWLRNLGYEVQVHDSVAAMVEAVVLALKKGLR